jgi:hypothetical protein
MDISFRCKTQIKFIIMNDEVKGFLIFIVIILIFLILGMYLTYEEISNIPKEFR